MAVTLLKEELPVAVTLLKEELPETCMSSENVAASSKKEAPLKVAIPPTESGPEMLTSSKLNSQTASLIEAHRLALFTLPPPSTEDESRHARLR